MTSILAFLFMAVALVAPAQVREEILRFHSLLEVQPDGGIVVTETITVRAAGREIKRGIYRDLPVNYIGALGDRRPSGFKLLEAGSDVTGPAHFTKRRGDDIRIYVGERSQRLATGVYTYTFRYTMEQQVGLFEDFDEIYWNVTGNRWIFPINEVTARIVVPEGAKITRKAGYTGPRGATEDSYGVTAIAGNIAEFTTTQTLAAGEGITVAVGWPKGFVASGSNGAFDSRWVRANSGLLALFASTLAVPFYLLTSWIWVGRDPEKGIVIPLFGPPKGLSPAAVSYIHFMALKAAGRGASIALIAALVSLAVKGRIRLAEGVGQVSAELVDRRSGDLSAGERALLSGLLASVNTFTFNPSNATRFALARKRFQDAIKKEHRGIYFKDNAGYFWFALAIGAAGIAAFFILQQPPKDHIGMFVFIGVASIVVAIIIGIGQAKFQNIVAGNYPVMIIGVALLFGIAKGVVEGPGFGFSPAIVVPSAAFMVMVLSFVVFAQLLRAPTLIGRKTMDQIEGLKLYLSVAEADRMNMNDAPDMSAKLFEQLLPYAIALGVERPWSFAFSNYLAKLVPGQQDSGYEPDWYSGRSWNNSNFSRTTDGMMTAMSDSMASATPVSSGSGSGGGGSSGGGGGGGGGGGW